MKYLVTGGCGFIGSHLIDLLINNKHQVVCLDNLSTGRIENVEKHLKNSDFEFINSDISNHNNLNIIPSDIDIVFHLAALADIVPSIQNPEKYFQSNVVGTFNLLHYFQSKNLKKFIYAASASCYGIPTSFPTSEDANLNPQYPYALTKLLGEEILIHWGKVYKIPVISLRLFNVYGPRSRTSGTYGAVFGVFLAQKLAKQKLTIVGDGEQTRDFTYVADVADAFYTSSRSDLSNQIMNVGSGGTYSVNYLASLIGGETVNIPERPGEPKKTYADISKINKLLGWKPKILFEDGVQIVMDNIEYWKNAPVWDEQKINIATEDWFKYLGNSSSG